MTGNVFRDKHYWAASMAAPLFVAVLIQVSQPIGLIFTRSIIIPIILLVIIYPVLEEVVFRGLIQGLLLQHSIGIKQWRGISVANILSSLAFVLSHLIYHSLPWSLIIIIPSLIFGFFRERYQNITLGIILHCWYNACYYFVYLPQ